MLINLETGSRRPGMDPSRKRTRVIQRTKGACTTALVVAFGCAIFGVSGAAAGDGSYARAQRAQALAGAALAQRTPEQVLLAIKPKAGSTPASATTITPAATTAPVTITPPATPIQPVPTPTTTGAPTTTGTPTTKSTTTAKKPTGKNAKTKAGTATTGSGDSGKTNPGTPSPSPAPTATSGNGTTDNAQPTQTGGSTSGRTCHGRCNNTTPTGGGVLPQSLPSSGSQATNGFTLGTSTPASTPATPPVEATTASVNVPAPTPAPSPTPTPTTRLTIPVLRIPNGINTPTLRKLSQGKASPKSSHKAPSRTGGAGTGGAAGARPTGLAAGTAVAAAPAAAAAAHRSGAAHPGAKHHGSGGSGLGEAATATVQTLTKFVKVIPTIVWVALAAAFGLALVFAAVALRSSRRARRREKEFVAISAAAQTDALTGILNRRGFVEAAERELARASRYDRPFVLAYVDVRGLKAVNDTEGHLMGDELLGAVAGLMRESARADDVVGRIGGDEFALLLDEQTAPGAEPVVRRIQARVQERRAAMEIRVPWELTIGIAAFPEDGNTLEELLGVADRRLYEQRGIALR
jgi:diguanylate cyclase (GGDEF)-like protein